MASSSKLTIRLNRINSVAEGGIRGEHERGRGGRLYRRGERGEKEGNWGKIR